MTHGARLVVSEFKFFLNVFPTTEKQVYIFIFYFHDYIVIRNNIY